MRVVSTLLFIAVAGLIAAGIVKIRHDYLLNGTELIGWALVSFALLLGFTLPVRCRVKRTNRKACGNWAYGLLFGCRKAAGHWSGKFLFRLGLRRDEITPVTVPKPKGSYAMHQPAPPQSKPVKVTVEENALAKCGFWVGLVSGIVGLTQTIISLVH
jgi:apolipoprotein N-acyltransferase